MTPDKQRVAIAEWCGWTELHCVAGLPCGIPPGEVEHRQVPDYLNDYNAILSAWECLGWEEKNECVECLKEVVEEADCESYFATAAQRAEAFLKTIGKWEES